MAYTFNKFESNLSIVKRYMPLFENPIAYPLSYIVYQWKIYI